MTMITNIILGVSEKFGIPEEDLKNLIEGAVYELNAQQKSAAAEEDIRL